MRQVISQTLDPFLRLLLPGGRVAPLYLTSRIGIGATKECKGQAGAVLLPVRAEC
jgi:hypothetical protein